jgi:anaphase-promoting complex subunit 8
MLDSLVSVNGDADTDTDSPMDMAEHAEPPTNPFLRQQDPVEAALEAQEFRKYLLAKSYFDTREYDRCSAVFLPPSTPPPIPLSSISPNPRSQSGLFGQKSKSKRTFQTASKDRSGPLKNPYPRLSQKSLFLALYAKYLAGEKRRDEETEMVLGPADGGMTVNRELPDLARGLEAWFNERRVQGLEDRSQGWLEYLYAVVLLKAKNEGEAKKWLIRSVNLFPFHWGAWQELNELLASLEDVSSYVWRRR